MSLSAAPRVAAASISSSCYRLISPFQDFTVHAHNVELFHEANCFVRVSLVVAGLVKYSPSAVTSDPRQCVSSRLLSAGQCSAVWPPWLKWWSKGHMVLVGLCICSCWQEDIVPLFPPHPPCFNQSAMAYMVCCGPKIRRRKLNNVFLFFEGRAMVGWL